MNSAPHLPPTLHVVLYQPEIPQNVGNIGRTCVAIGAKLWLVRPLGFRLDDARLRRAGLDYWSHLIWQAVDDWQNLGRELSGEYWYLSRHATRDFRNVSYPKKTVLVFGNESQGLPDSIRESVPHRLIQIPTRSTVRSLNLANAVAIAAYEVLRQFDWRP